MRSFEKKPTKENLLESLQNNSVGQNENLFRFVSLCGQFEDTTSIALDAKWGSGKTFFVRQAKMIIDACNEQSVELTQEEKEIVLSSPKIYGKRLVESTPPMVAVYYDAWENDNDSDPLLSLIYSILQNTMIDYSIRESEGLGDKLSAIVDLVTGRDFSAVVKALKSGDPFSEFKRRDNLRCQINELLESLYQEKGERLIIIVDELDRCKPSFSVHLLERIKHYFIDERITFVFSINASELLHTIEQHYGAGFDATRYLDRFFNFIIPLPSANINQYRALLGWSEEERGLYEISADTFIKHWGLTLRELERYYRAIKTAVDEPDRLRDAIDGISKGNVFACNLLVPLVIGLGMTDKKMQESFIHGQDAAPLLEHVHYNRDLQDICWYNLCEEVGSPFDTDTLSQNDLDKLLVDAYNLIFNAESYNFRGTKVGRCVFTDRTKEKVVRIAGLLSKNAAF